MEILYFVMVNVQYQDSNEFPNSSLIQSRKTHADAESLLQSARYVEYKIIYEIKTALAHYHK